MESKQRNLQLSEERAGMIADTLRQYDVKQSIKVVMDIANLLYGVIH